MVASPATGCSARRRRVAVPAVDVERQRADLAAEAAVVAARLGADAGGEPDLDAVVLGVAAERDPAEVGLRPELEAPRVRVDAEAALGVGPLELAGRAADLDSRRARARPAVGIDATRVVAAVADVDLQARARVGLPHGPGARP